MSQTVEVRMVRVNEKALQDACAVTGAKYIGPGKHKLWDGKMHEGIAVKHPAWNYQWVFTPEKALFDNHGGAWGPEHDLHRFCMRYDAELARQTVEDAGLAWHEEVINEDEIHAWAECPITA